MDGYVNMDIRELKGVDVVHDIQRFPFPFSDNTFESIIMNHVWEHIEPKFRICLMNELWRISIPDGTLAIVSPHCLSAGACQDPTHYTCPNEFTFQYFDVSYKRYSIYKPKPWKLENTNFEKTSTVSVVLKAVK